MKVSPKHLYIVDKVKKIYESIIKIPVHRGQGTCITKTVSWTEIQI